MARRKNQLFNLSFLDLITGALGAVIFLFVITPKGGSSASDVRQVAMYLDTSEMKIFGDLHDSLTSKQVGDTLFTVLVDYKNWPKPEKRKVAEKKIDFNQPKPKAVANKVPEKKKPVPPKKPVTTTPKEKVVIPPKKEPTPITAGPRETTVYKGDAPSVPCKVSFELNWASKDDNVDFFVCKGNNCVYGGRKRDRSIGQWDSGKSRNRLFGNDLRTNQEAIRQFDEIIPGEYLLYAQFKESKRNNQTVRLNGLIYTKGKGGEQRGESFVKTLPISKSRVLLGKVVLQSDGRYKFIKK